MRRAGTVGQRGAADLSGDLNEALVQGGETACAVLTTTPQGQPADAQFVKWLME